MHDAVVAERNGVPAISVMTSAFADAAELMARVQGVPHHPFAVIEHPIASADAAGIDARAQECISNEDFHEIQCEKNKIYNIKKKIEKKIKNFISTEIEWKPLNDVEVSENKVKLTAEFLDALENDDDVQRVYANSIFGNN